jgi:glycosyltransferase involved in cell wall biosynthesis
MTVHVSVVIPTRNRPDLIGQSIRGVLANTYPDFDVTVIDQSDDGGTRDVVHQILSSDPRLRYMHTLPAGLSRAYNIGITSSTGEILAFTDDDCIAHPDWIASVAAAFAAEPDASMLYGQVLRPAAYASSPVEIPTLPIAAPSRISKAAGFRIYGMGANFAARRSLFDRVGLFDEILGGGGPLRSSQDFDFAYRVFRGDAVLLLRPDVRVDHYGVRTAEQWPATLRAYGIGDGAFYTKHVRCGDLYALSLLARRLGRMGAREALNGIRRKSSMSVYLRGCLFGIRESFKFGVDRRRRMYAPRTAAGMKARVA